MSYFYWMAILGLAICLSIVVSSAPIMCMYPLVQKYFNQGVMLGSLKG